MQTLSDVIATFSKYLDKYGDLPVFFLHSDGRPISETIKIVESTATGVMDAYGSSSGNKTPFAYITNMSLDEIGALEDKNYHTTTN